MQTAKNRENGGRPRTHRPPLRVVLFVLVVIELVSLVVVGSLARRPELTTPDGLNVKFSAQLKDTAKAKGTREALAQLTQAAAASPEVKALAHDYAHELGSSVRKNYATAAEAMASCDASFLYGCLHGVASASFAGATNLNQELDLICAGVEASGAPLFATFECLHGVGHGLADYYKNDLTRTLTTCDHYKREGLRQACYSGAFMENVNVVRKLRSGQLPQGAYQDNLREKEPFYPCIAQAERYRDRCYKQQASIILMINNDDIAASGRSCSLAPSPYQKDCAGGLGREIYLRTREDPVASVTACKSGVAIEYRATCYDGALGDEPTRWDALCAIVEPSLMAACTKAVADLRAFRGQ